MALAISVQSSDLAKNLKDLSPPPTKWEQTAYMKQLKIRRSKAAKKPSPPVTPQVVYNAPKQTQIAPQGNCMDWIRQAGVDDVNSAYQLIMRESGCNPTVSNPYSGACGIPQELPCGKSGCGSDPVCQIRWMQSYCKSRYGSWANALSFQIQNSWY